LLVDSHAHLDHERYDEDRDAILERAWKAGVRTVLSIGIGNGPETMDRALGLARAYAGRPGVPRIYASAGIHPQEAQHCDAGALRKLEGLLAEPEVIACGEIGLDFYHDDNPPIAVQREAFRAQMEAAARHRRPILIHCRPGAAFGPEADAWEQTLAMIEEHWAPTGLGGVLHCFSGDAAQAERAVGLNFMISFAGNVTYPSATVLREAAAAVPAERLLVETDCPFLAPMPNRGKRNEPALVAHTAELLAGVRGISSEELALLTTANFHRFFGLVASDTPGTTGATAAARP
jgi:TatD DNase family protein